MFSVKRFASGIVVDVAEPTKRLSDEEVDRVFSVDGVGL